MNICLTGEVCVQGMAIALPNLTQSTAAIAASVRLVFSIHHSFISTCRHFDAIAWFHSAASVSLKIPTTFASG
jgi:hypothetical protein